ncbi:MAG TPA: DUF1206 domain-containing protein [Propionibacteriaceae bacterium]|nr:DUF1206 domain-containing protein [Propionibacteriaceae bacterium]
MRTNTVTQNQGYRTLVTTGLISYGVVHAVIAWIALQVAWGGRGDASSQGALRELGSQPLGSVLLWVVAAGMFTLVVWQALEAAFGYEWMDGGKRLRRRLASVGRAIVYLAIGISAARVALGSGGRSGDAAEQTLTARLMSAPFGRILVAIVGLAVIAVGVSQIVRGVRKRFKEELTGAASDATVKLGTAGFTAKGVALIIIGLLFGWAAATYDPDKAGGIDAALKTIRDQPFGSVLLTVMALGILAFGLFCFSWSRRARF